MGGYQNQNRRRREPTEDELRARCREHSEREARARLKKMLGPEVGGLPIGDWQRMGKLIALYGDEWRNIDSMDTVLRIIRCDAELAKPQWITLQHLRVAMSLVALGKAVRDG